MDAPAVLGYLGTASFCSALVVWAVERGDHVRRTLPRSLYAEPWHWPLLVAAASLAALSAMLRAEQVLLACALSLLSLLYAVCRVLGYHRHPVVQLIKHAATAATGSQPLFYAKLDATTTPPLPCLRAIVRNHSLLPRPTARIVDPLVACWALADPSPPSKPADITPSWMTWLLQRWVLII